MAKRTWTRKQVVELGIRTDGVTACAVVYGVGPTKARELLHAGAVDFKLIKVPNSRRYVVPVSSILKVLDQLNDDD